MYFSICFDFVEQMKLAQELLTYIVKNATVVYMSV